MTANLHNSVLLVVHLSKPGNRRKVPSGAVEVDADRESISVAKELLQCQELEAILALDGEIRRYVYSRALPSGVLKTGVYRLPLALVDEVDAELTRLIQKRQALVEAFLQVYPAKVEEARVRLRAVYDASDYPEPARVREAFYMEWRYLTLDVPGNISAVLMDREREKAARDIQAEAEEIRQALRTAFAELVEHAAERLQTRQDGKPLVFRDSLVKNLEDFMAYFQARNLTGDNDLEALVEQARAALHGDDPNMLRTHTDLRHEIQQAMAGIKATLDANTMLKPQRRFTLEGVKVA